MNPYSTLASLSAYVRVKPDQPSTVDNFLHSTPINACLGLVAVMYYVALALIVLCVLVSPLVGLIWCLVSNY